ncbi:MAG: hypothetical protein JO237_06155, partial [Pseudolabrys sp.]|nr:hypothetical protein [Pseudolabrys sp.]
CDHLVLATGKVGLRGIGDERDTSLVGLKMHLRLEPGTDLGGCVEIAMLEGGYAGLERVEDGIANLCLVLPREVAARIGTAWEALRDHLCTAQPALAARLEAAEPLFDRVLAVACPTGGHLHEGDTAGAYRVGDRLAHIPPFTGDGIAIALASATLAAAHIRRGLGPDAYFDAARRLAAPSIKFAAMISALAGTRLGSPLLFNAAALAPGVLGAIARKTRLPARLPIRT